ncbi:hypothetical protein FKQ62_15110 [Vibrio sp. B1-2]|uniref:hypothetical protein n=1 Tax=Vibrio sp. B1-2 TaxID=2591465 RepID=UPI0014837764|nr:hypothetical protein [Vibrio sp. B1-2]NNO00739.1 hypothetical protein [Vibrio sp. B1-2]
MQVKSVNQIIKVTIITIVLSFYSMTTSAQSKDNLYMFGKILCNELFLAERNLSDIIQEDLFSFPDYEIMHSEHKRAVEVRSKNEVINFSFGRNGCIARNPLRPDHLSATIQNLIEDEFYEDDPSALKNMRLIYVKHKGKIIGLKKSEKLSYDSLYAGYAFSDALINILLGSMIKDNYVDINRNNLFDEWSRDERNEITIENLARMTSGLEWNEALQSDDFDVFKMIANENGAHDYCVNKGLANPFKSQNNLETTKKFSSILGTQDSNSKSWKTEPGESWNYSSCDKQLLTQYLVETLRSNNKDLLGYLNTKLNKLGVSSVHIDKDSQGNYLISNFTYMTVRDWLNFADGIRNLSQGNTQDIIDKRWWKESTKPTQVLRGAIPRSIGFSLNGNDRYSKLHLGDQMPKDTIYVASVHSQYIIYSKQLDLLVVILGGTDTKSKFTHRYFLDRLMDVIK